MCLRRPSSTVLLRLWGALIGLIIGCVLGRVLGDKVIQISKIDSEAGLVFYLWVLLPLFGLLGAIMMGADWRFNLRVIGVLLALAGGFVLTHIDAFFPPPKVEHLGNFELLTYNSEERGYYYKLRYRGKPFSVKIKSSWAGYEDITYETLNAVITFTLPISFSAPAFVVNVEEPSFQSYFHLVREVDGRATTPRLCSSYRNVSADWLDVKPSDPTAPRDITVHRKALAGGRWLLLGDACVLDVWTLTAYPFPSYYADATLVRSKLPIGLSPDHRSLVRVGTGIVGTRLIVYNFIERTSYSLPVEQLWMPYNWIQEIDAVWLVHYFEWKQSPGVSDRLVPRRTFTPLP